MNLLGLEINATRLRAVSGPEGTAPQPHALSKASGELPAAISMQNRTPEVGSAGMGILREWPHLVCHDFLAQVGKTRVWTAGRHRFDAAKALTSIFESIRPCITGCRTGALVLPAYLTADQGAQVLALAQKCRVPAAGALAAPLATGLAAFAEKRWTGMALAVDVDDHALTWTLLRATPDKLQAIDGKTLPHLSLFAWKMGLLDAIAERCVKHSRRDPRDSGVAEQLLFDQLGAVFEATEQEKLVEVVVRTETWCQNLFLQPEQVTQCCRRWALEAGDEVASAIETAVPEAIQSVWLSALAGRLPGLAEAIQSSLGDGAPVTSLYADAPARAAHESAAAMQHGRLPHTFLDVSIPLPKAGAAKGAATFLKIPTFAPER